MTNQHPITPPPELVGQWLTEAADLQLLTPSNLSYLATKAARWGADQELEACVNWLIENQNPRWAHVLHSARRPKPPSLKEQALRVLVENGTNLDGRMELDSADIEIISRALEALPE
jgi:hypothetical protein